jgi:hypothetical protein
LLTFLCYHLTLCLFWVALVIPDDDWTHKQVLTLQVLHFCYWCCRVSRKSTAYDTDAGTSDQGKATRAAAAGDTQQQYNARDAAGRSTDTAFYSRSSTFESAAAAGAAAAALMEGNPSVIVSPTSSSYAGASPDATAAAAAVAAAAAAATAKAAAHHQQQQQHDQDRAPWDDTFHLPSREPPAKRPPVNVEPWRPPKPSEAWKPSAPWRPPSSKYDIPPLAPAEQFPRSVPLDEQGTPMRMQPIRCGIHMLSVAPVVCTNSIGILCLHA